jgi:hypothetical protein
MFDSQEILYSDDGRYAITKTIVDKKLNDVELKYYLYTEVNGKTKLGKLQKIERTRGPTLEPHGWGKEKDVAVIKYHDNGAVSEKTYYHPLENDAIVDGVQHLRSDCRLYKTDFYGEDGKLQISRKYTPIIDGGECISYNYCDYEYDRNKTLRRQACDDGTEEIYDELGRHQNSSQASEVVEDDVDQDRDLDRESEPRTRRVRVKEHRVRRVRRETQPEESEPELTQPEYDEPEPKSSVFVDYDEGMKIVFIGKDELIYNIKRKMCAPYIIIFESKEVLGSGNDWIVISTTDSYKIDEIWENKTSFMKQLKQAINNARL